MIRRGKMWFYKILLGRNREREVGEEEGKDGKREGVREGKREGEGEGKREEEEKEREREIIYSHRIFLRRCEQGKQELTTSFFFLESVSSAIVWVFNVILIYDTSPRVSWNLLSSLDYSPFSHTAVLTLNTLVRLSTLFAIASDTCQSSRY